MYFLNTAIKIIICSLLLVACRGTVEVSEPIAAIPAKTDRLHSKPQDSSESAIPEQPPATAEDAKSEPPLLPENIAQPQPTEVVAKSGLPVTTRPKKPVKKMPRKPVENIAEKKIIPGINRADSVHIKYDGIHDPDNPGIEFLQNPAQSLSAIPEGRWGEVDWMQALNKKTIQPRADIHGSEQMNVLELDIIMKNTKTMPYVRFPHNSHTRWLACINCHPDVFVAKKGANNIKMNDIFRGRFCGTCHGKVSFSSYICQRCHSIPHAESPPQWWE